MQKRILSLFLVLCMVLALVPSLVLPLMAEETETENYVTTFRENIPTLTASETYEKSDGTSEEKTTSYSFQYHDGWTTGKKTAADNYERYGKITSNDAFHILCLGGGDQWGNGGFYIDQLAGGKPYGKFISPKGMDTAIQYKAVYTGTVLVEVNDMFFTTNDTYFGVFVNGQMIWPNTGDYYTDNTKWLTGDKDVNYGSNGEVEGKFGEAIEVAITAGDMIEFVGRVGENAAGDPYGYYSPQFTITYTERTAAAYASAFGTDFRLTPYNTDGVSGNANAVFPQNWDAATMGELTPETLDAYLQNFFKLGHTNLGYGAWSVGVFNDIAGTYEAITRINAFADKAVKWEYDSDGDGTADGVTQFKGNLVVDDTYDLNWGVTESGYQAILDNYIAGKNGSTSPWSGSYGAAFLPAHGSTQPSNTTAIYAYQYSIQENGVATFSFDEVRAVEAAQVAIYVNNVKVWPAGNAWYNAFTNNAEADKTALNEALADVSVDVFKGDVVRFAVKKTAWLGASGGGNGVLFYPAVSVTNDDISAVKAIISYCDMNGNEVARYTCNVGDAMPNPNLLVAGYDYTGDGIADEIPATVTGSMTFTATSEIVGTSRFDQNFPSISADGKTAVFTGNWKTVKGNWNVDYAVDTETQPFWTYSMDMDQYAAPAFVGADAGMWNGNGGGCYANDRKFAVRTTASGVGVGAMYTVPYSGVVDIFYTNMQAKREANATTAAAPVAEYFAILLNGEVIWPSTGTPWLYTTEEEYSDTNKQIDILTAAQAYEAFPTNITVSAGDEIVFVGNQGNDQTWMAYFDGAVTYTDLIDIQVDAGVSLGDAFGVDFYITPEENATEYGVEYDGELIAADENGYVSVYGVAAKELGDEVVVTPYQVINGTTIYGEEIAVTVAELLYEYVDGEDELASKLAIAMLNYGAAAQTYFNYFANDLVNEDLTDEQKTVAYTGTYAPGTATDLDGATVDLQSVTLLLEDYISLKLVVDSKEEGLKMEASFDAEFTESELGEMEKTADETGYKITAEIPVLSWNDTIYFRVVDADGNAVSRTIAYSVTAYCANMAENETVNGVTNAILALYEAAVAYMAE
ncbi:MAG: hypothetical protein IJY20_04810 [Clostridia bacterium]|nr:hypothetical protein [Clostridia bacterium]